MQFDIIDGTQLNTLLNFPFFILCKYGLFIQFRQIDLIIARCNEIAGSHN